MRNEVRPRRRLRRILGHSLFAGIGVVAVPAGPTDAASAVREDTAAPADDDTDDVVVDDDTIDSIGDTADVAIAAHHLATLLARMNPFDATRVAAVAALSSRVRVRRVLAKALAFPFPLVGDDFVLDQLARDIDLDVRIAASSAARVRHLIPTGNEIANSPHHPRHPRVLVVDDYPGGRAALCDCLSELGCDVLGTSSKIASYDVEWRQLVDVVVANHDPPWSDGEKLVVQLREHAPDLPVILMRDPTEETAAQPTETHGEITLVKPIAIDDLASAIDTLTPKPSRLG